MPKTLWVLAKEEAIYLADFWEELSGRGEKICLAGAPAALNKKIKEKNWTKIFFPSLANIRSSARAGLVLFWPILIPAGIFYLWFLKKQLKITKIILLSPLDFGFWFWPARWAGIKIIWLVLSWPEKINKSTRLIGKKRKQSDLIIVFNRIAEEKLKALGFKGKIIKIIPPGINPERSRRQENIFSSLAKTNKHSRKFFVIGTVLTNNEPRLEPLFAAGRGCLSAIPNLQIIVVGDAANRKKTVWLAEKIGLENVVWFVGRPNYLNKYLEYFDLYIPVCPEAGLRDMILALEAQANGVPVVCRAGIGFEEIVKDNKTGLILAGNESEKLAQAVIKLKQNSFLHRHLAQTARDQTRKNNSLAAMANNFQKIF